MRRCLIALLLLLVGPGALAAAELTAQPIVAYHDSWAEPPAASAAATTIARLPGYLDVVILAFARPDLRYNGDLDLGPTGLEYRIAGTVLRDGVALLRRRNPAVRVLLGLGGSAYGGWRRLNLDAAVALVRDLGLDGVDLDYEPSNPGCVPTREGRIACVSTADWEAIAGAARIVLPRPMVITASVWSVGAYGEDTFRASQPRSRHTGSMLGFLRSDTARRAIDIVLINAYDAGPSFNPLESFRAYRAAWPGRLALGIEVAYPNGAGPFPTTAQAEAWAREVRRDRLGGMMIYALLMQPPTLGPDGAMLAAAACRGMGRAGCDANMQ